MIRTFTVEVTRVDEYKVEIDDSIINEEWMAYFENYFWKLDNDLKKVAAAITNFQARFGDGDGFIEGFGYVKRDGKLPFSSADLDENGEWLPEEEQREPNQGLNIIIVNEDNDIEIDVTEITSNGQT